MLSIKTWASLFPWLLEAAVLGVLFHFTHVREFLERTMPRCREREVYKRLCSYILSAIGGPEVSEVRVSKLADP